MLVAAMLGSIMRPTKNMADNGPIIDLESMISKQFGDWREDPSVIPIQVSPDVQAELNKVYNQTLARTYINSKNERIMLSLAYGKNQSDNVQIHLPEGCYGGQGFAVSDITKGSLETSFGKINVARLEATKGTRFESITYWVVVGKYIATDTWGMKLAKLKYTLNGNIPDGLLIRISSANLPIIYSYSIQRDFAEAMLAGISPNHRVNFLGEMIH